MYFFDTRHFSRAIYPAAKRVLDVIVAAVCLILLAPLMALIAIAIKLDSSGPVFHRQRRVGQHGRVFDFYKFRSMTNSREHLEEHRKFAEAYINGAPTDYQHDAKGEVFYKPAAHRQTITRVGRWLRKTSFDELPQLFNVLKDDMSMVGPRPAMDYELTWWTDRHHLRLAVPAGLTGLAQISGRSSLSFDRFVDLDLEYIARRSVRTDLAIILATVPSVLRGEHAG